MKYNEEELSPTISKSTLIHALTGMDPEHMAHFMNAPRVSGFNAAKSMLLKMVEQCDDEIDREKFDDELTTILMQKGVPGLSSGHETDMYFWTVTDFSAFVVSYPNHVPRSMEHIYPELLNRE